MQCIVNRRDQFSVVDRYWSPELSEIENLEKFGAYSLMFMLFTPTCIRRCLDGSGGARTPTTFYGQRIFILL
jgi:hypothetical protein